MQTCEQLSIPVTTKNTVSRPMLSKQQMSPGVWGLCIQNQANVHAKYTKWHQKYHYSMYIYQNICKKEHFMHNYLPDVSYNQCRPICVYGPPYTALILYRLRIPIRFTIGLHYSVWGIFKYLEHYWDHWSMCNRWNISRSMVAGDPNHILTSQLFR